MAGCVLVDDFSIGRFVVGAWMVCDFSIQIMLNDVSWTCGAVVIQKIVAIDAILGSVVGGQCVDDGLLLFGRQVQYLFCHLTAPFLVIQEERHRGCCAQVIVGLSEDESQDLKLNSP